MLLNIHQGLSMIVELYYHYDFEIFFCKIWLGYLYHISYSLSLSHQLVKFCCINPADLERWYRIDSIEIQSSLSPLKDYIPYKTIQYFTQIIKIILVFYLYINCTLLFCFFIHTIYSQNLCFKWYISTYRPHLPYCNIFNIHNYFFALFLR